MDATSAKVSVATPLRGRCRCGHFPTDHMASRAIPGSASFRLDAGGPCTICGEASCRAYTPAGAGPSER